MNETRANLEPGPLLVEDGLRLELEDRLAFETLVADLSARFVNLAPDQLDGAIEDALRHVVEALHLDRGSVFQTSGTDGDLMLLHVWPPSSRKLWRQVSPRQSFPWTVERLRAGEVVCFSSVDEIPDPITREGARRVGTKSGVVIPLAVGGAIVGAVAFNTMRAERRWPPEIVNRLRLITQVFAAALARKQSDEALKRALSEVERLRDQLQQENVRLRRETRRVLGSPVVIGKSPSMARVLEQVRQVAETDATVLLLGETGSGKELFASQIHDLSARHDQVMVRVNCAAIPSALIESELFGRERGAYTGALSRQVGRFELADRSTIFLDEIGDLSPDVQVKLLRVLENRQIERLGSPKPITVDVRIVAATHRDLEALIASGAFREDLYYRLNVFPIRVPPLREREADIPQLVWRFIEEFGRAFGKEIDTVSPETMAALQGYSWPGNVRELRNVIERAMIVAKGPELAVDLPTPSAASKRHGTRLLDVEKDHILAVLDSAHWRVRGQGGAAERLGMNPSTLETRMAKLGIKRPPR